MQSECRKRVSGLLFLGACLTEAGAMAAKPLTEADNPPQSYRIEDVTVSVTRQPGRASLPVRRVVIAGTGRASLEREGLHTPFAYPAQSWGSLLNSFYAIRFFDLPASYTGRYSVVVKDDGTVRTSARRTLDESTTQLCFALATYEKCVSYGVDAPADLERLAARILAEADSLAAAGRP